CAMSESNQILHVRGVKKSYHDGTRELQVLRSVDLDLKRGESLAIIGASGCGKSTLLHLLGALDSVSGGTVSILGRQLNTMNRTQLAEVRLHTAGFVFQAHHLLGELNALENVALPMIAARVKPADARRRSAELLDQLGLAERK